MLSLSILYVCLSVRLSVSRPEAKICTSTSVCLSVCLSRSLYSLHLAVCLSVSRPEAKICTSASVCVSDYLSVCLLADLRPRFAPLRLSVCLSRSLSLFSTSVCLSVCLLADLRPRLHLYVCLSVRQILVLKSYLKILRVVLNIHILTCCYI